MGHEMPKYIANVCKCQIFTSIQRHAVYVLVAADAQLRRRLILGFVCAIGYFRGSRRLLRWNRDMRDAVAVHVCIWRAFLFSHLHSSQ